MTFESWVKQYFQIETRSVYLPQIILGCEKYQILRTSNMSNAVSYLKA